MNNIQDQNTAQFVDNFKHAFSFQDWLVILKSFLITPWLYIGTPWTHQQKSILPFNVFLLISGSMDD